MPAYLFSTFVAWRARVCHPSVIFKSTSINDEVRSRRCVRCAVQDLPVAFLIAMSP